MSQHHRPADISTTNSVRFPEFSHEEVLSPTSDAASPRVTNFVFPPGRENPRWQAAPRRTQPAYQGGWPPNTGRGRQKSLSDAFKVIKDRRGSVSENAAEIAEALKAPVSPRLVALCGLWYMTSIFSSASSKAILTAFRYPITLTVVQFAFVSSFCILSAFLASLFPALKTAIPALKYPIRSPTRDLILTTLPLTAFQIGGHILNSDAMARIPVSLVHTIKGLSPLFTVLAYRLLFRVHYSPATYLSLLPLTLGVIMACSTDFSGNTPGILYAFGSALLFVTQNIVSKRLFNEAARAEQDGPALTLAARRAAKPDKLNLLCYSSGLAFLLTTPLWFYTEGLGLLREFATSGTIGLAAQHRPDALDHGRLALEFLFNGITHFAQSLVAFILLSMVSPVTYSVASLLKRVFVVTFAIVWFGNSVTGVQSAGIGLTFFGLYLYDRTNDAARGERKARAMMAKGEVPLLPLTGSGGKKSEDVVAGYGYGAGVGAHAGLPLPQARPGRSPSPIVQSLNIEKRRMSASAGTRARSGSDAVGTPGGGSYLLPGTKMEETWMPGDGAARRA